jgi:hypothetical protein
MDKKSKILMWVFVGALIISVGATYYRYVVKRDYIIFAHAPCDPEMESCFYYPCEEGDTECSPADVEYYKKINKKAYNIELCDSESPDCQPLVCQENEADCEIISCSEDVLEDGEACSVASSSVSTSSEFVIPAKAGIQSEKISQ